jgi:hypothetical protein
MPSKRLIVVRQMWNFVAAALLALTIFGSATSAGAIQPNDPLSRPFGGG